MALFQGLFVEATNFLWPTVHLPLTHQRLIDQGRSLPEATPSLDTRLEGMRQVPSLSTVVRLLQPSLHLLRQLSSLDSISGVTYFIDLFSLYIDTKVATAWTTISFQSLWIMSCYSLHIVIWWKNSSWLMWISMWLLADRCFQNPGARDNKALNAPVISLTWWFTCANRSK